MTIPVPRIVAEVPATRNPIEVPWAEYVLALKRSGKVLEFEFATPGTGRAFAARARNRPEFRVQQREMKVYLSLKVEGA